MVSVMAAGNVNSFSFGEKVGMRGKEPLLSKVKLRLLMNVPFPLTLALSLGEREHRSATLRAFQRACSSPSS